MNINITYIISVVYLHRIRMVQISFWIYKTYISTIIDDYYALFTG